METVIFKSNIKNNTIQIPEQYYDLFPSSVLVAVMADTNSEKQIVPRTKIGTITEADFGLPSIDTAGWKFDREEANER